MTPAELRKICESLNDERGNGGQTRLARMLKRSSRTIRNKLAGKTKITQSDVLAIERALEKHQLEN
jgi:plasmid maintenance system antidote protein VapI